VQEYNNLENRDTWEYPLRLTRAEIDLLVAHAWELNKMSFPYYFLKKNCAYYLLSILEVVKPELELVKNFRGWTIPVDTIRILQKHNLLGAPTLRPSRRSEILAFTNDLPGSEIGVVKSLALKGSDADYVELRKFPREHRAQLLEAAYEYALYRKKAAEADRILSERAALPDSAFSPRYQDKSPPEAGHPTSLLAGGLGFARDQMQNKFGIGELRYRGAFHDRYNRDEGYEAHSTLIMGDFRARLERGNVFLNHFDLLRIESLTSLSRLYSKPSWNFYLGGRTTAVRACESWKCFYGAMGGGIGLAFDIAKPITLAALAEIEWGLGSIWNHSHRFAIGPGLSAELKMQRDWKLILSYMYTKGVWGDVIGAHQGDAALIYSISPRAEWVLKGEQKQRRRELLLSYGRFF
jgi:hypothetical protein